MSQKTLLLLPFFLVLASCTSDVATKWTGTYPNSTYVSKLEKTVESAVVGAANSPANLVIFSDFQCPACIRAHAMLDQKLWNDYILPNKITVTFKNYPLTTIHKNAEWDALAALCALSYGNVREFRDAMYALEDSKRNQAVSDEERVEVAKKAGISDAGFGKCLSEAWYQKSLEREIADGDKLGIEGTPSFYLNGTLMDFRSADEFFAMIDATLKSDGK